MESDGRERAHAQLGLDLLLEDVDVVLKFAREKFADFLINAVDVGDQRQQAKQQKQRDGDGQCSCHSPRRGDAGRALNLWRSDCRVLLDQGRSPIKLPKP